MSFKNVTVKGFNEILSQVSEEEIKKNHILKTTKKESKSSLVWFYINTNISRTSLVKS